MTAISANDTGLPDGSYEADDFMPRMLQFYEQCTDREKVIFLITLDDFAEAESAEGRAQCLAEFKDWYLKRRGLPLDAPLRGDQA